MKFKVIIPSPNGTIFHIEAPSGEQAKQEAARRIRHHYPRLTLSQIASMASAFRVNPKSYGGRHKVYRFPD